MKNPFIHNEPVIPPIFAGREHEINIISKALFEEKDSIIIYGNDAIGKSSLVSTMYKKLETDNNYFPVRINAFDFIKAVKDDFLSITTHQICAAIWTRLMGRKYSELIEDSLTSSKQKKIINSEENTLKRIFKIITSQKLIGASKINKELGGKYIIEGKISSINEISNERKPLAPFEFIHLLDELNDIIAGYNYSSILVFCDELNHLPEETNSEILRNYFGIFSSKKIQFIIVAVNPELTRKNDYEKLIESFNFKLEIKPFNTVKNVQQLINNSLLSENINLFFEENTYQYLFEITDGHPWFIQKICNDIFLTASINNLNSININLSEKSAIKFRNEIEIYKDKISLGLPFRKYDIKY